MDADTIKLIIQMVVISLGGAGSAYAIVYSLRKSIAATREELKAELSKLSTRIALVEAAMATGTTQFGEIRQDYKDLVKQIHSIELTLAKAGVDTPKIEKR